MDGSSGGAIAALVVISLWVSADITQTDTPMQASREDRNNQPPAILCFWIDFGILQRTLPVRANPIYPCLLPLARRIGF